MSNLSDALLLEILCFVDGQDLLRCERISRRFHNLVRANRFRLKPLRFTVSITFEESFRLTLSSSVDEDMVEFNVRGLPQNAELRLNSADLTQPSKETEIFFVSTTHPDLFDDDHRAVWKLLSTQSSASIQRIIKTTMRNCRVTDLRVKITPRTSMVEILEYLSISEIEQIDCLYFVDDIEWTFAPELKVLPSTFFQSHLIHKITSLKIHGDHCMACHIDDSMLLGLRNLKEICIQASTHLTIKGIRQIFEDSQSGQRAQLNLLIVCLSENEGSGPALANLTNLYKTYASAIHGCSGSCTLPFGAACYIDIEIDEIYTRVKTLDVVSVSFESSVGISSEESSEDYYHQSYVPYCM